MSSIHEKLAHLSLEQIDQIMARYYIGLDPVKRLVEEFRIDVYPNNLYSLFPPKIHEGQQCPYCKITLISIMPSKSELQTYVPKPFCPDCGHQGGEHCQCISCGQIRMIREEETRVQKMEIIFEAFKPSGQKIESWDFDLEDLVYFLAYVRIGANEDFHFVESLDGLEQQLSPNRNFDEQVIQRLWQKGLIAIHELNTPDVFTFIDGKPERFFTFKTKWRIGSFLTSQEARNFVKEVEDYIREAYSSQDRGDILPRWEKIAIQECLAYLQLQMDDHNLPFSPGEKTEMVLKDALQGYSIGQVFYFIWGAVQNAAAFYQRDGISIHHAANTVPGTIQRRVEKARAGNWNIETYRRDRRSPQSSVSQVFYTTLMKMTGQGIERPILFSPPSDDPKTPRISEKIKE